MTNLDMFLSKGKYVLLPPGNYWKVILNVTDPDVRRGAFQLYRPFSLKAKLIRYFSLKFSFLFPKISISKTGEFIAFLENKLHYELLTSLYRATDGNKYVIQLQDRKGIVGYCKASVTSLGKKRIKRELKAISILKKGAGFDIPSVLLSGNYDNHYFIIYEPVEVETKILDLPKLYSILSFFRRYKLSFEDHPRVRELYEFALFLDLHKVVKFLESWNNKSYWVVYEHGDFAPWNVILTRENRICLIDFELFEEQGFEDLDLIKYYFQVFSLLKKRRNLIRDLTTKLGQFVNDFEIKFVLFLLSEMKRKKEENQDLSFYKSLLISYLELLDER